jgi:hypothetical protein
LNALAEPVRVQRGPDQLASVPSMALFYPGSFRIEQQGRWQIAVRIGPDSGCLVVRVDWLKPNVQRARLFATPPGIAVVVVWRTCAGRATGRC